LRQSCHGISEMAARPGVADRIKGGHAVFRASWGVKNAAGEWNFNEAVRGEDENLRH